jgi:hypothetical protein
VVHTTDELALNEDEEDPHDAITVLEVSLVHDVMVANLFLESLVVAAKDEEYHHMATFHKTYQLDVSYEFLEAKETCDSIVQILGKNFGIENA